MFNTKYSKKQKKFLKENLKKLRKYLEKKNPKNQKEENKYINKFLDYKISNKDSDKINKLKLLQKKHLKNSMYFMITELGESNKDFYKAGNLYEYTKKNWLFQKEAFEEDSIKQLDWQIKRNNPNLVEDDIEFSLIKEQEIEKIKSNTIKRFGKEYEYFYSYGSWCRWIINNSLTYGTIESVENYFVDKVSKIVSKKIEEYIPSCFTHYPDKEFTPNSDKTLTTWNMETRANGREEELIALKRKSYQLEIDFVKDNLDELIEDLKGKTFKKITYGVKNDAMTHLYIPDIETAKLLSTENFLVDFYRLEQPFNIVKQKVNLIIKIKKLKKKLYKLYKSNLKEFQEK